MKTQKLIKIDITLILFAILAVVLLSAKPSLAFPVVNYRLDRGAYWNGRVWIPGTTGFANSVVRLDNFDPDEKEPIMRKGPRAPCEDFYLLAGEDRLWLIGPEDVFFYKNDQFTRFHAGRVFDDISQPVLFKNRPVVLVDSKAGLALMQLSQKGWKKIGDLPVGERDKYWNMDEAVRMISIGRTLYVQWRGKGSDSLFAAWNPEATFPTAQDWRELSLNPDFSYMAPVGGQPAFFKARGSGFKCYVTASVLEPGDTVKWKQIHRGASDFCSGSVGGVYALDKNRIVTFTSLHWGAARIAIVQNGKEKTVFHTRTVGLQVVLFAVLFLFIVYGLSIPLITKSHPSWIFKLGPVLYKKSTVIKGTNLSPRDFLGRQLSPTEPLVIRMHSTNNTLTVTPAPFHRLPLSQHKSGSRQFVIEPTIFYFEQIAQGLRVTMIMRFSPLWLGLAVLLAALVYLFSGIVKSILTLSYSGGLVGIGIFGALILFLVFMVIRDMIASCPLVFDHIIALLGIEDSK